MSLRTSLPSKPCIVVAAAASILVTAPASSADQGAVQIVAIAPAFCRVMATAQALALSPNATGTPRRTCNTVNEAQITAQVSNLDGATLRLGGADIAVSASGSVTLTAGQLASLSDLRVVNARPADAPVDVELTVTPQ